MSIYRYVLPTKQEQSSRSKKSIYLGLCNNIEHLQVAYSKIMTICVTWSPRREGNRKAYFSNDLIPSLLFICLILRTEWPDPCKNVSQKQVQTIYERQRGGTWRIIVSKSGTRHTFSPAFCSSPRNHVHDLRLPCIAKLVHGAHSCSVTHCIYYVLSKPTFTVNSKLPVTVQISKASCSGQLR